jgi:hypothetical protein
VHNDSAAQRHSIRRHGHHDSSPFTVPLFFPTASSISTPMKSPVYIQQHNARDVQRGHCDENTPVISLTRGVMDIAREANDLWWQEWQSVRHAHCVRLKKSHPNSRHGACH